MSESGREEKQPRRPDERSVAACSQLFPSPLAFPPPPPLSSATLRCDDTQRPSFGLLSLCDDALLHALDHLPLEDLVGALGRVSRGLRALLARPEAWRNAVLDVCVRLRPASSLFFGARATLHERWVREMQRRSSWPNARVHVFQEHVSQLRVLVDDSNLGLLSVVRNPRLMMVEAMEGAFVPLRRVERLEMHCGRHASYWSTKIASMYLSRLLVEVERGPATLQLQAFSFHYEELHDVCHMAWMNRVRELALLECRFPPAVEAEDALVHPSQTHAAHERIEAATFEPLARCMCLERLVVTLARREDWRPELRASCSWLRQCPLLREPEILVPEEA